MFDGQEYQLKVPEHIITEATDYFDMMDSDMNRGYQMSRRWVESPDQFQRCQIAADHILTALETDNGKTATMMAAYILNRMPTTQEIHLNIEGDMMEHDILEAH
jgi:hypothetical protein